MERKEMSNYSKQIADLQATRKAKAEMKALGREGGRAGPHRWTRASRSSSTS